MTSEFRYRDQSGQEIEAGPYRVFLTDTIQFPVISEMAAILAADIRPSSFFESGRSPREEEVIRRLLQPDSGIVGEAAQRESERANLTLNQVSLHLPYGVLEQALVGMGTDGDPLVFEDRDQAYGRAKKEEKDELRRLYEQFGRENHDVAAMLAAYDRRQEEPSYIGERLTPDLADALRRREETTVDFMALETRRRIAPSKINLGSDSITILGGGTVTVVRPAFEHRVRVGERGGIDTSEGAELHILTLGRGKYTFGTDTVSSVGQEKPLLASAIRAGFRAKQQQLQARHR